LFASELTRSGRVITPAFDFGECCSAGSIRVWVAISHHLASEISTRLLPFNEQSSCFCAPSRYSATQRENWNSQKNVSRIAEPVSLFRIEPSASCDHSVRFMPVSCAQCELGCRPHFFDNNAPRKSDHICGTRILGSSWDMLNRSAGSAAKTAIFKPAQTI